MPRTKTIEVYSFEDLSDEAKERAREWWREGGLDYDWWDSVYDDAKAIARILGIEFDQKPVPLVSGKTRYDPTIYFSGFCSQGDGACFEGRWSPASNSPKLIRDYAPQDTKLHQIADDLYAIGVASAMCHGGTPAVSARVKHRGHYYHSLCTEIEVFDQDAEGEESCAAAHIEERVQEALRAFMDWIYRTLEREYEWLMSDEHVDEAIEANEYEFDEDGDRL